MSSCCSMLRQPGCLRVPAALCVSSTHQQVLWRPSQQAGAPRRIGPVRFRQHYCRTAGLFTGTARSRPPTVIGNAPKNIFCSAPWTQTCQYHIVPAKQNQCAWRGSKRLGERSSRIPSTASELCTTREGQPALTLVCRYAVMCRAVSCCAQVSGRLMKRVATAPTSCSCAAHTRCLVGCACAGTLPMTR